MFLTLVSAALVGIALVGQATGFADEFTLLTTTVLAVVAVVGVLTQLRVVNAALDDLMYVVAMNRLRGAYTELDPKVARAFLASPNNDITGVQQTYYLLGQPGAAARWREAAWCSSSRSTRPWSASSSR